MCRCEGVKMGGCDGYMCRYEVVRMGVVGMCRCEDGRVWWVYVQM